MEREDKGTELSAKSAADSRMSLSIITHPEHANFYGTLHGGVLLRLADECGALAALRHAGGGRITTAAIDSYAFLCPVYVGERVDLCAEVTYVGRTSLEVRIEIHAEPVERAERRLVGVGYGLYVTLDEQGTPRPVPPLLSTTEADRRRDEAARARQAARLARRAEARREAGPC